jgi:hypothetical protein
LTSRSSTSPTASPAASKTTTAQSSDPRPTPATRGHRGRNPAARQTAARIPAAIRRAAGAAGHNTNTPQEMTHGQLILLVLAFVLACCAAMGWPQHDHTSDGPASHAGSPPNSAEPDHCTTTDRKPD